MITSADAIVVPSWRAVLSHPAHFIAFGFGAGKLRPAPGTWGTLLAIPLFGAIAPHFSVEQFLLLLVVLFGLGVWACGRTGRYLRSTDHSGMVWDEVVAFMLVLAFTPRGGFWTGFAFLLFRLFDIAKPPPIRHVERTLPGGLGVMADDIVAAFYALLVMAFWKTLVD